MFKESLKNQTPLKNTGLKKSAIDYLSDRLLSQDVYTFDNAVDKLEAANPEKIQEVAASQIRLLNSYYETVLHQAKRSFLLAVIFAAIGTGLFLLALIFIVFLDTSNAAIISIIGGALIQVISGINFVLYGKTSSQLSEFHNKLEKTQRFLLANSVCESLKEDLRGQVRTKLVYMIAGSTVAEPKPAKITADLDHPKQKK